MQTSARTIMRASPPAALVGLVDGNALLLVHVALQRVTQPRLRAAQAKPKTHLTTKLKEGRTGASRCVPLFNPAESPPNRVPSPLLPLKQIPRIHLVRHVRELVAPAVGDDHVAAGLEGLQVVRDLGAKELRRVQRGLVDHHGHALGLHALHDALDGARAEVVGVGLHRQAVDAHDRLLLAGVHAVPYHLQHLVGHEVLAGTVGVHDGLDQVLGHVLVVRQQLLGVLGQAVAAVAEAGERRGSPIYGPERKT